MVHGTFKGALAGMWQAWCIVSNETEELNHPYSFGGTFPARAFRNIDPAVWDPVRTCMGAVTEWRTCRMVFVLGNQVKGSLPSCFCSVFSLYV